MASQPASALPLAMVAIVAVLLVGCTAASPSPTPTASAAPTQSPGGLTRDQAVAAARAAVPSYANEAVMSADVGTYAEMAPGRPGTMPSQPGTMPSPPASAPPPDRLVWRIALGEIAGPTGGPIATILIDFWTGAVILSTETMS